MWERDCFSNLFFGKQPIENKFYFYNSSSLTKDIFSMAIFFYAIKHQNIWKIIFIEGFSVKQLKWELINVKEMCQWIFKCYDYDCSIS